MNYKSFKRVQKVQETQTQ